jgi:hypothetical protein
MKITKINTTIAPALLCMAAALLVPGIHAQQGKGLQIAQETDLPKDFDFKLLTKETASYGSHRGITGAKYGPLIAFRDSGEAVAIVEFFDKAPVRAIVTTPTEREIAEEHMKIGDITVLQIRTAEPFDLQMNNKTGDVGWSALIEAKECGPAATCVGLFVESKLLAVTAAQHPSAWALTDDGKIAAAVNHNWVTPAPGGAATAEGKGNAAGSIVGSVKNSVLNQIKNSIRIPGGQINVPWSRAPITVGAPSGNPLPVPGAAPSVAGQPGHPPVQQTAPFERMAELPYCTTPSWAWPAGVWNGHADAAGPIASERQEPANFNFTSLFHPAIKRWQRKLYFASDCRLVLVAGVESPGVTQEIHSPVGLIASFDASNLYRFNGVPPVALPPASEPIEDGIRLNRRCAVLALVSFKRAIDDESALIVGVPTREGHCAVE